MPDRQVTVVTIAIGLLSVSGIIGGSIPTGVGAAFACQSYGKGQVTAVFFGDGAVNTGAFHEALNMASVLQVPAVFVCLNNQYGISTYIGDALAGGDIAGRAHAYGLPGIAVDGNDAVAVFEVAEEAVGRARAGEGPTLIEAVTYRIGGHSSTNPEHDFMDEAKFREFRARDPLILLRQRLIEDGHGAASQLDEVEAEAKRVSDQAIAEAKSRPFPPVDIALEGTFV